MKLIQKRFNQLLKGADTQMQQNECMTAAQKRKCAFVKCAFVFATIVLSHVLCS